MLISEKRLRKLIRSSIETNAPKESLNEVFLEMLKNLFMNFGTAISSGFSSAVDGSDKSDLIDRPKTDFEILDKWFEASYCIIGLGHAIEDVRLSIDSINMIIGEDGLELPGADPEKVQGFSEKITRFSEEVGALAGRLSSDLKNGNAAISEKIRTIDVSPSETNSGTITNVLNALHAIDSLNPAQEYKSLLKDEEIADWIKNPIGRGKDEKDGRTGYYEEVTEEAVSAAEMVEESLKEITAQLSELYGMAILAEEGVEEVEDTSDIVVDIQTD